MGFEKISGVSVCVSRQRHRANTGKDFPLIESAKLVAVAVEHLTRYRKVTARTLAGPAQIAVVLPECNLSPMSNKLRIRKGNVSGCVHQSSDMVGVRVGEQDRVDIGGFDAGKRQIGLQAPAPLPDAAGPAVDKNCAARSLYHVAVDMHGGRLLLRCIALHPGGLGRVDIRQEVEARGEVAVADCSDREIPGSLTWKGSGRHNSSPEDFLISGMNVRRGITETTDTRRDTRATRNGVVEGRHELVHNGWRAKRFKAILDFREDGMAVPVPNFDMDDMNVFERRSKDTRTEFDAVAGKLFEFLVRRHLPRRDIERDVGHRGSTFPVLSKRLGSLSVASSSVNKGGRLQKGSREAARSDEAALRANGVPETSPVQPLVSPTV